MQIFGRSDYRPAVMYLEVYLSSKNVGNFEKKQKTFQRFQMLPSASERAPTHPGRSEQVQTRLGTRDNFEKLAKTSRKLREGRVRAVLVLENSGLWQRRACGT